MKTMNVHSSSSFTSRGFPMKTASKISVVLGLWSALALAAGGCIEPPTDINRVQPGYSPKSTFEGEWYMRHLVVDKQFQGAYPFAGYEGALDRVRFEITEDYLIAHRSYERVPGTELADGGEQSILAMFPIVKHFDIRRDYNPVNGVESNVIVENTTDRPWWERDYIRVDWARNEAPDADLNGFVRVYSRGAFTENNDGSDPTDPWRVRIEDDYIEVTADVLMDVDYYACSLAGDWYANCGGSVARLKTAFRKVDPENDYEPLNFPDFVPVKYGVRTDPLTGGQALCYDGDEGCEGLTELWVTSGPLGTEICDPNIHDPDSCFQYTVPVFSKFGFFRTDRFFFDRENDYTLTGRERLINRWNLWERSKDAAGNPIPYADRATKPVVYYLNVQFPEALIPAVQDMANDWDIALRDTVAKLQNKSIDDVPRMYEVRANDCNVENVNAYMDAHKDQRDLRVDLMNHGIHELGIGNLENACAVLEHYSKKEQWEDPFHWQQLGDLRYSFVNWVAKTEIAGPLGYGPSAADPLTGEIISANANIYGASLDTYANISADYVDLLNGRITTEDVINGTHVREHVEAVRARYRDPLPQEKVSKFLQLFDQRTRGMSDERYLKSVPLTSVNSNLDRLAQTGFEEEFLVNTDMVRLFGGKEAMDAITTGIPDELLERAKPSRWARDTIPAEMLTASSGGATDGAAALLVEDPTKRMSAFERFRRRADFLGRQNFCYLAEQVEPALADLAAKIVADDMDRDEVVHLIRSQIMRAVLAHEVGHTLGLRHNFEGSADPLNFFPEYWNVDLGQDDHRMAGNPRKSEVQYSTIMDYHQRFNSDWAGIGLYDKAAIKFGYGQLVEVFDEGRFDSQLNGYEDAFVPRDWDNSLNLFYPSDLPYLLAGGTANDKLNTLYDNVIDELIGGDANVYMDVKSLDITPRAENLYKRKDVSFADYKRQEMMRIFGDRNADGSLPLIAVPYSFCSDAYAWGGNLTCNRWDMGTTSEEIVQNAAEMYEFYYPFQAFRGQRLWDYYSDGVNGYLGRLYDRTYQPMLTAFRYFYYYRRSTASIWPLIRDWSAASYKGMNFFGRVLQTPEPGRYCLQGDMYVPEGEAAAGACDASSFQLGLGDARYYDTAWTDEFDFRPQNVGHVFDKMLAIQAMTTSNAFFLRDFSNFFSRGAFSIGYYRVFQPEMLKLYGGLLTGDNTAYAPQVHINGKPTLVYQPLVQFDGEDYGPAGVKIKPTDSYILRYYAMFFGMANLTSNVDFTLDFAERSRITLVGSSNDPVLDPSTTQVVFTDPLTHYQYRASAPDGAELSIGYRMLKEAADFVNDGTNADPEGAWAVAKRELEEAEAGGDADEIAAAQIAFSQMNRKLNEKVQLIDAVRQLADVLEYGN